MTVAYPEEVLQQLALLPAASFHEERVAQYIQGYLSQEGVPFIVDRFGNIIAHYVNGRAAQALALVAHMDHPAFEVVGSDNGKPQAILLGGVGYDYFRPGTPLRICTDSGAVPGFIASAERTADEGRTLFTIESAAPLSVGDWGVWEMADYAEEGDLLHLRAADDLAGCALALSTLAALRRRRASADVYGVFTRAEEVGLLGATLVAQEQLLPSQTMIVSVEASRALPGAEQGAGPVIRVGDRRRTFHAEAEVLLHAGWEALRKAEPEAQVQRQLMSGGTCEATAFSIFGYAATSLALPLGNYHNMGPDAILAPEYIHRKDLAGAGALLLATVEEARTPLTDPYRRRLEEAALHHRARLDSTANR